MNIDERLEALTMNLELFSRDLQDLRSAVQDLKVVAQQDGENIRTLAGIARTTHDSIQRLENIAAAHEQRLDDLENQ
jgi:hypothetical protein